MEFSFIHIADIHLGRPFSDLSELGDKIEVCNQACTKSLNNIINFAIDKKVDFILVAGDSFDNDEHDISTKLLFRNSLKKLADNGIKSYVICGNHDPAQLYKKYNSYFKFDEKYNGEINITGVTTSGSFEQFSPLDNVKINSLSFENEENDNPVKKLSEVKINSSDFNIGLIHCDLEKSESKYAPVSKEELRNLGYDYYALGHIHIPEIREDGVVKIVYAGSTQGRTKKETGEHGCYYVKVADKNITSIEFIPTDVVRFLSEEIDCSDYENRLEVLEGISEFVNSFKSEVDLSLLEINLTGISKSYQELNECDNLVEEFISNFGESISKNVGVYKINNNTLPYVNEKDIEQDNGIIGIIANFEDDEFDEIYENIAKIHDNIYKKLGIDDESKEFLLKSLEKDKNEIKEKAEKELKSLCNEVYSIEKI